MLTNDDLDTIYARAHDAADWYFTDDVIALVGELRAERTRVHQLEWDKSLVESELAGVSENLAAERTRTETLREALNDAVIGLVAVYGPDSSMVSDGRAVLAASVEETP